MKNSNTWLRLSAAAVALLALTGCGGDPAVQNSQTQPGGYTGEGPAASTPPAPRIMGPGKYTFKAQGGGTGTLQVPGSPVPEIEELRAIVNAPPVTYITGTVDNREGTEAIRMVAMSIFTPEGRELKYEEAFDYIGELSEKVPTDAPFQQRNKFGDVSRIYLDPIPPLAVKDFILVGPEVPAQITGITVAPNGTFNPVPAEPAH